MREIKESYWKVFRKLHPVAVEQYCERVLAESESLHRDTTRSAHERYRALYRLFRERDKELARLFDDFRRTARPECLGRLWSLLVFELWHRGVRETATR